MIETSIHLVEGNKKSQQICFVRGLQLTAVSWEFVFYLFGNLFLKTSFSLHSLIILKA